MSETTNKTTNSVPALDPNKIYLLGYTYIKGHWTMTDENTGEVFRRELPIDYFENANFLRLSGENLDGSLSQLVFYTPRGIERVKDVSGKGPDHDRCGGHSK